MTNKDIKLDIVPMENANDFIGIKIKNNEVILNVPGSFRKEKDEKQRRNDIVLFLKSINIASTLNVENIKKSDNDDKGEMWPIDSFLWILNDYLENGYYFNREKMYSHDNKGKIDWKRTLKSVPIYSKGNLIFDKLVTTKMTASNDIITQIYKLCLSYSYKRIGWLFNYYIHVDVQQVKSNKEMIYIIDNELNSTFDDIKRLRFKHMLKILNGINNENALSNRCTYGITNYYYVFEKMVDKFFQGIKDEDKKKFEPGGYWHLNNHKPQLASNLKPDTIYRKDDITYIIDAKMYRYGYTKKVSDLPMTSSMQKQITYGDYVANNLGIEKVRNAFIIPYDKGSKYFKDALDVEKYDDLDNNFAYIGKAYVDWREDKKDHDYIYTFLIDFNYLLNHYNEEDNRFIKKLCDKIEENVK